MRRFAGIASALTGLKSLLNQMKKEEIQLWDWQRILIGNTPWEFMLEVFIRTVLIYLVLLVVMRLLGKQLSTNISILSITITVTLGAIVSPAMQLPDRGVLLGTTALLCLTAFHRIVSWLSLKNRKIEVLTQGDVGLLVKNAVIDVVQLRKTGISHEELFEQLRKQKIFSLGQVKRVYLEASGQFSIFKYEQERPGLCIMPDDDEQIYRGEARSNRYLACKNCGKVVAGQPSSTQPCANCGVNDWDQAVQVEEEERVPVD